SWLVAGRRATGVVRAVVQDVVVPGGATLVAGGLQAVSVVADLAGNDGDAVAVAHRHRVRAHRHLRAGTTRLRGSGIGLVVGEVGLHLVGDRAQVGLLRRFIALLPLVQEDGDGREDADDDDDHQELDEREAALALLHGLADSSDHAVSFRGPFAVSRADGADPPRGPSGSEVPAEAARLTRGPDESRGFAAPPRDGCALARAVRLDDTC